MILRFRGRDGQFRVEVDPEDDFPSIEPKLAENLPKDVDLSSITVGNRPHGGEVRALSDLRGVSFERVGLK